jgi:hypothetical protein
MASEITPEQVAAAAVTRAALMEHLDALLADGAVRSRSLSASPSELLASPSELFASPSELFASPSELFASPSELVASPSALQSLEHAPSRWAIATIRLRRWLWVPSQVLMVPSTPGPAPVLNMNGAALDEFRGRALALTSIAGLGQLPQVRAERDTTLHAAPSPGVVESRGAHSKLGISLRG